MRVLLVEDNDKLSELLVDLLGKRGISVDHARSADAATDFLSVSTFDAIILDLGLPDQDGLNWLASLPADRAPVLIMSARSSLAERIKGLDTGADDYMVKPADIEEIAARLRALVRRPGTREPVSLSYDNIEVSLAAMETKVGGNLVALGRREFDFLATLMRKPEAVVARETLEARLYSANDPVTPNALEAVASRLRKRLADNGVKDILHTVRGIGYYFGKRAGQ